jgi:putative transposase
VQPPCRNTVRKRIAAYRQAQTALLARKEARGSFGAAKPLEIVQIDHTQADVFHRRPFHASAYRQAVVIACDRPRHSLRGQVLCRHGDPHPGTVAPLISRIVLAKEDWIAHLGLELDWPMHGIPKVLHLDNAAEFHGRALRLGCAEYGIGLEYRPVGRPHFGGHIERLNRTLMQRLKGLPGATGNSLIGRKAVH